MAPLSPKLEEGHGIPPMISFDYFTHISDIDEKETQALYCKAKINFMAAELSEVQQKLNVEQKLSGQYKAEHDWYEEDLGHTREDLGEVRKELADLRKEHSTCKTFWIVPRHNITLLQKPLGGGAWGYVAEDQFRGQQVAVKCVHEAIITQHTIKRVYHEICTMAVAHSRCAG